jgi:hypothetical protein
MSFQDLKIGDTVGLQYDYGMRINAAQIIYVGLTCYQLSNGFLYRRVNGRCVQGSPGGRIVLELNLNGDCASQTQLS